jgi:hypothetical protein
MKNLEGPFLFSQKEENSERNCWAGKRKKRPNWSMLLRGSTCIS